MTRINTNVSSLVAQTTLARSNANLQTSLARLSTGLRINRGKDDPAGLIASESLRSDIISVEKAITNSERANQLIATADSALGQVSQLINDIRGLISEAANTGALSEDQIAANQLQVDSSLEAIDRIAQITSFQGKRLLDGNLDFITQDVDSSVIGGLQIDQANFGTQSEIGVQVNVVKQATRGELNYSFGAVAEDVVLEVAGGNGTEAFNFAANSTIEEVAAAVNLVSDATGVEAVIENDATAGQLSVTSFGGDNDIVLTADNAGFDEGNVRVKYSLGNSSGTTVNYTEAVGNSPATIDVQLQTTAAAGASGTQIDDTDLAATTATYELNFGGAQDAGAADDVVRITSATEGDLNDVEVRFVYDSSVTNATATFDAATNVLEVKVENPGATTTEHVKDAIDGLTQFSATGGSTDKVSVGGNTLTQTTRAASSADNNALDISALISGSDFNGTDIHIVHGDGTEASTGSNNAKSTFYGTGESSFTVAVKSGSALFSGDGGSAVTVKFSDNNGDTAVTFNASTNELTISYDADNGSTTNVSGSDIVNAFNSTDTSFTVDGETYNINDVFEASVGNASGTHFGDATGQDGTSLGETATAAQASVDSGNVIVTAKAGSKYSGAAGNGISLQVLDAATGVTFDKATGVIAFSSNFGASTDTVADTISALTTLAASDEDVAYILQNFTFTDDSAGGDDAVVTAAAALSGGDGDILAVSGAGLEEAKIEYHNSASKAEAAINGFSAGADTSIKLEATAAGTDFNDVNIKFAVDNSLSGDTATAAYDSASKTLTISVNDNTTTADTIIAAIDTEGTFDASRDVSVDTGNDGTGVISTADLTDITGNTRNSGTDAGALVIHVNEGLTSVDNIISALGASGNERAAALFSIASSEDNDGTGVVYAQTHDNSLSGGQTAGTIVATGQDVIDAINASGAGDIVTAALADGNSGVGTVSEFQEATYVGQAEANNRLQFLSPEESPNIKFVTTAGSSLSVDLTTDPRVESRATATLAAENANASLNFRAVEAGSDFDNVQVRFTATASGTDNTVTFDQQESQAQAVVEFAAAGNNADLLLTANTRGADFNDYTVVVDTSGSGTAVTAVVDSTAKTLTITVNGDDASATGAAVLAAINTEGTFTAELDYADSDTNTGLAVIATGDASASAATFSGGGASGGVLEFNIANGSTSAQDVIDLLANDDLASTKFQAIALGSLATGNIDVRNDSNNASTSGGIESNGTIIVNLETDANGIVQTTADELIAFFDDSANAADLAQFGVSVSNAEGSDGSGLLSATEEDLTFSTSGTNLEDAFASGEVDAVNGKNARISITAVEAGAEYDGVTIVYESTLASAGTESAAYNETTKTLTVSVKSGAGASTAAQVKTAIDNDLGDKFTAALVGNGSGAIDLNDTGTLSGGVVDAGTEDGASLQGNNDLENGGLTFRATQFGSDAFVSVKALSGSFSLSNIAGDKDVDRSEGTDVNLRINGIQAIGDGLKASINTSSLDLSFSLSSTATDDSQFSFTISGGGALFQLGPDVVSNQQARLGIQSVSTATLGGVSGRLFELRSGGAKSLSNDVGGAAKIVDEVIRSVTQLRGRLGAFQKTTLESNIFTLNDTLANLTDAESSIRDADFAEESANLTRAQILVQSGTSVLGIANQNPQNVLGLLR
ncbi:MAG: hypothetical protein COA78_31565 [Blastopirellula sp.]|nr:MAG: hypothetical protein COA78_31565 [Blastopirellula sp.]